ncbi:UNVERIFIED_CONTAM: hypothetical protein PYX00_009394 [Menopon gallinae]|uniref:Uncharacterized protein n=1 Tax=Menopon gallinae TaxID=328185 RepID=A0AAW2HBF3_9NEOP
MEIVSNLQRVFKLVLQGGDESKIKEITPQIKAVPGPLQISRDHGNTEINVDVLENVLNSLEKLLYIFHVSYESKFSVYIEFIFQEIQNLLDYAACNNILSSIPFNQFINVFTLAIKLHISHSCDDKTLVNFHTININKVKSRYNSDCDIFSAAVEELTWRLKLISVFYDIFSHTERHNSNIKNLIKNMGAENVECSLFSKLVTSNSDIVAAQTLLNVIPKYINFSKSNLILQYVWNELTDSMSQKNNSIEDSKIFIILCYLSEFYFVPENNKLMAKILKEKNYWTLLQRGLVNPDSAVRKQALYLMKATLSYCTENGLCGNELQQNLKNLEFCLREDDIENFKELCVIIEYLEEKQVHIIQPIFNLIEKFVEKFVTMKGLSVSWIMVMIQRMLCHDNLKIVRGGISNLLKIPVTSYQTEEEMRTSVKSLIFSLNSTQIYMIELSAILDELKHYFEVSSKAPNGEIFFRILIQEICDKQWSSEALFFIIYSLQSVSSQKFWKREELDLVKNLITCGAANHYTYIKSGMQCQLLLVAINLLDTENVCLEDVAGFLNCFHRKTSLQRGTNLWSRIVNWIKDSYTLIDLENIIVKSLQQTEQRNNVKMILVAYDAYKNNEEFSQNIFHLFRNISESFVNIHIRPYCNVDVQDFYLSVICDILRESGDDLEFLKCFTPSLPEIILYIEWQLGCIHHVKDVQRSQNLLKNLSTILNFDRNRWSLINVVNKWFEKICKLILHSDSYKDFPVKKFIMIRTLNVMVDYSTKLVLNRDILSYLRSDLNSPLVKTSEELSLSKNFQTLWGKMNSEYVEGNWKLLSDLTDSPPDNLGVGNGKFIDLCLEALDIGGYTVLPPLMTVLGKRHYHCY